MCDPSRFSDASDLARLAYPIGIAQHILAHFADGRHRQRFGAKFVAARNLITADQAPAMGGQLFGSFAGAVLQHDHRVDAFAPLCARDSDHRRLAHRGVHEQDPFDLDRIDVLAARGDHVLDAVGFTEPMRDRLGAYGVGFEAGVGQSVEDVNRNRGRSLPRSSIPLSSK
jgi:hypothetical protein